MNTLIALFAVFTLQPQDAADRMLKLATADQPIVTVGTVPAPVQEVWKAWSRSDEITKWMVPSGTVEMRIGGKYRTSYTKGSDLSGPEVIENTILAFDPERMITIKTTKTPERFPFKRAMESCWTVIYMEPDGPDKTRVAIRMLGYSADPESVKMKEFFTSGNQETLDALIKRFGG